jgi:RHS repeat-associated protein
VIDLLKSPGGKMETSFPSSRFLRLGEKSSQTVETEGRGSKTALCHFDANGNLTQEADGSGNVLVSYTYDAANRLVSVTQGGTTTGYAYDGWGRRVRESSNGTVVKQWVWGDGDTQPSEERDASNNVTKRFYGMGEQIGGANYYYTRDHLGSVREMTNSAGSLVARYDYDPFGRRTLVSGTDLADFGFTDFYYDQASGLDLTWFRAYDASLGRWLTRDPIGENGGINIYAYVLNNPVNGADPQGLWFGWDDALAAIGGALSGVVGQFVSNEITGNSGGYASAALGGAVSGETLLYTANPILAGAAGGFTSSLVQQLGTTPCQGQSRVSLSKLALATTVGGLVGAVPVSIPGITSGSNSFNAINNQLLTKLGNGTISSISVQSAAKIAINQAVQGVLPGAADAASTELERLSGKKDNCGCNH